MKRWILALLLVFSAAQLPAATPFPEAVSTSTTTLTLQPTVGVYTFTGSSPATWTLPAVSGNKDRQIIIKNRGSATITVQRAGSDQLYTTSAVTSTTVTAGGWAKLVNDGVYWAVLTAGSGGLASTDIDTSAELAGILTDETGSGAAVFGTSPTFAGGTVSSSTPIVTATQTWNNAGTTFTGLLENVTNTNSSSSSKLFDFQVGGSTMLNLTANGTAQSILNLTSPTQIARMNLAGSDRSTYIACGQGSGLATGTFFEITGSDTSTSGFLRLFNSNGSTTYAILTGDAANTLALRNGVNAQAFNIYNTWGNSGTDYERLNISYSGNVAYIQTMNGGTGSARQLVIGTKTASNLTFCTNDNYRWGVHATTGALYANSDNSYDIGASGATRPRTGYFGTSLIVGAGSNVQVVANRNALTDYGRFMLQQNGTDKWGIGCRGDETVANSLIFRDETNGVNMLTLYQGTGGAGGAYLAGPLQAQMAQKNLTEASATAFVRVAVASNSQLGGIIHYTIIANDATDYQSRSGSVPFSAVNKGGTETAAIGTVSDVVAVSAGTLTATFDTDTVAPTNGVDIRCNATSSLTQTTLAIRYWVEITSPQTTITPK